MLATPAICSLYAPIIRVLGYYDVFKYPVTFDELHLFLPLDGIGVEELHAALAEVISDGRVCEDRGYYYLPHQDADIVDRRIDMHARGLRMWRVAERVTWCLRFVPFVRGVFISGQLCRYIADEESDIDYFVITAPERLWIVRTLLVFVRRAMLLNSRKYFCTNYYVTTENLSIRERNPYVACEVASLKPMHNRALFDRFMLENSWVTDFYPNFTPERLDIRPTVEGGERVRRALEGLFPGRLAAWLDVRLMKITRRFWQRKFPGLDGRAYDGALRTRPDESRAHPNDQAPKVLQMYHARLAQYGISDD